MKKILLTGATGRIGKAFWEYADEKYDLRLTSRNREKLGDTGRHEAMELSAADPDSCQRACEGIHTVVHLAADPSGRSGFYESLMDNNIKGAYNMFRAAKDQGCQRLIYASSVQAVAGYPLDVQPRHDDVPKPLNLYGVTKCFGEALAHYFAMVEGLSSIAVRIGNYELNGPSVGSDARQLSAFISVRDMNQMLERCIEATDVQYGIVQGVSDNRFKRMDITSTRELIGYEPQDDAFVLFESGIDYRDRWYEEAPNRRRDEA
jgi:NAD+ dependent glucose-6-phosphate dehydrogenase